MLLVTLPSTYLPSTSWISRSVARKNVMGKRRTLVTGAESRKLIVGLGNPGSKFNGTRHNIGFDLVDKIAELYDIPMSKTKFNSVYGCTNQFLVWFEKGIFWPYSRYLAGTIAGQSVVLVKPQTYMNLSGTSVKPWMDFYKIDLNSWYGRFRAMLWFSPLNYRQF